MRREREIPQNARTFIIQEVIRNAEMIGKRISDNDMRESVRSLNRVSGSPYHANA